MDDLQKAVDLQRKDLRARAIANSVVARVMQEHGPIDPERADREARDIAMDVAALMIQQLYAGDAELLALRIERDHWKEHALNFANLSSPSVVVSIKTKDEEEGR